MEGAKFEKARLDNVKDLLKFEGVRKFLPTMVMCKRLFQRLNTNQFGLISIRQNFVDGAFAFHWS